MQQVIFKYKVEPNFTLELPKGAEVLCVQMQGEEAQMWVLQEVESKIKEKRRFCAQATGVPFETRGHRHVYVGTFQPPNTVPLVFHLFEVVSV